MIVDHRTYELQPGRLREFLALYEKEGLPVQKKHLGNLVGFFTTEVGNVNEIVHIWAYEDLADRTKRRAAMAAGCSAATAEGESSSSCAGVSGVNRRAGSGL